MSAHGTSVHAVGYGDSSKLGNVEIVRAFLESLVGDLGMRALGAPHIYDVPTELEKLGGEVFEDEGGVTGVVVLSTSHVAIHTWPLRSLFHVSAFSCRTFNVEVLESAVEAAFGPTKTRISDVSATLEPPSAMARTLIGGLKPTP